MESYGKAPARTVATSDKAVYILQQEARQLALEKSLLSRDLDVAHLRQRAAEELANEAVAQAQKSRMTAQEQALRVSALDRIYPLLTIYFTAQVQNGSQTLKNGRALFVFSTVTEATSFSAGAKLARGSGKTSKNCF